MSPKQRAHLTLARIVNAGQKACEEEWGTEKQIEHENNFHALIDAAANRGEISPIAKELFDNFCHKGSTHDRVFEGIRLYATQAL